MSKFSNISQANYKNVKGSQVKVTFNKKELQPFYGNSSQCGKDEQLREALLRRNDIWSKLGITSRHILKEPLKLCIYSNTSNIKIHGLTKSTHTERRKNREFKQTDVIGACIRNLETGRATNRKFTIHLFKNEHAAINRAKSVRDQNIRIYNNIVNVYNEIILIEAKKLAKKEAIILKPLLHRLKKHSQAIWKESIKIAYPNGLPLAY